MTAVFFDIGNTLASVSIADDETIKLMILPGVMETLNVLKKDSIRCGIISNPDGIDTDTIKVALKDIGLYEFFDEELIIFEPKNNTEVFKRASQNVGLSPVGCVFIGESPQERVIALEAGFLRVSPHSLLTLAAVRGEALVYATFTAPDDAGLEDLWRIDPKRGMVPLKMRARMLGLVHVVCTIGALDTLLAKGLGVSVLGKRDLPLTSDLYLVPKQDHAFGYPRSQEMKQLTIADTREGVYLGVPWNQSVEDMDFSKADQGHPEKLSADPLLLRPFNADPRH